MTVDFPEPRFNGQFPWDGNFLPQVISGRAHSSGRTSNHAGQKVKRNRLRDWAREIKKDVVALYLAARDPRVPWYVKLAAAAIAAYALSPIDLIPDFIPVLGYLDEVIILPVAIALMIRMIPASLLAEFREEAQRRAERPTSRVGAVLIVALWVAALALTIGAFWPTPVARR